MIAADPQGQFLKGISTNGETGKLGSDHLSITELIKGMQMLVRQGKYCQRRLPFLHGVRVLGGKAPRNHTLGAKRTLLYVHEYKSRCFG